MTRRVQLVCVWCGPVMLVLLAVGFIGLAGFLPAPHPTDSGAEIKSVFTDDLTAIRIGLCLVMAGVALIAPWGASVAAQTHRIATGSPVLTFTQIACVAVTTMIGVGAALAWGVTAFRPEDIAPDTTRAFNDLGWVLFIFDWSPLFVWYMAVALAIFSDPGEPRIFPRWAGYLSVWVATLSIPGGLMICFKTGPFAYNGLLALYVPLGVFAIWVCVMTALVIKAINAEALTAAGAG